MNKSQTSFAKGEEKNSELDIIAQVIKDLEKNKSEKGKKVTEADLGITQTPSSQISAKDSKKIDASKLKTVNHPHWMNGV